MVGPTSTTSSARPPTPVSTGAGPTSLSRSIVSSRSGEDTPHAPGRSVGLEKPLLPHRLRMAAAPPGTALRLARIPGVGGGVLDEGDDPRLHEAAGADRLAGAGHLGDLDHPADGADLHLAPGASGVDLVCPHPVAGVDHHLDPVALHLVSSMPRHAAGWILPGRHAVGPGLTGR